MQAQRNGEYAAAVTALPFLLLAGDVRVINGVNVSSLVSMCDWAG